MWVDAISGQVVLSCIKNEIHGEKASRQNSVLSASVLPPDFLHWVPVLAFLDDGL